MYQYRPMIGVGTGSMYMNSCGGLGCHHALMWLQGLVMGVHTTVEAGNRSQGQQCAGAQLHWDELLVHRKVQANGMSCGQILCALFQKAGEASHSFCSCFFCSENCLCPGGFFLALSVLLS